MVDNVNPVPWPIDQLPFFAEHGSWQELLEPNVVDFAPEVGPPKRRRRSYIPSTRVQFQRTISTAQLNVFLEFFEFDLRSGVYNFTAVDPRTQLDTEYSFMQVPSWRDMSPGYWKLQFALRRVNLAPAQSVLATDGDSVLGLEGDEA